MRKPRVAWLTRDLERNVRQRQRIVLRYRDEQQHRQSAPTADVPRTARNHQEPGTN